MIAHSSSKEGKSSAFAMAAICWDKEDVESSLRQSKLICFVGLPRVLRGKDAAEGVVDEDVDKESASRLLFAFSIIIASYLGNVLGKQI